MSLESLLCTKLRDTFRPFVGKMKSTYRITSPGFKGNEDLSEQSLRIKRELLILIRKIKPPKWNCSPTAFPTPKSAIRSIARQL